MQANGAAADARVSRRRRLRAAAIDAATVLPPFVGAAIVTTGWLLLRTDLGRTDVGEGDAVAAVSLVAAAAPAWSLWLAARVRRDGATAGQRLAGLRVSRRADGGPNGAWRRQLRLAVHPLALPLWGWLTLTALLSGVPRLWLPPAFIAAAVAFAGLLSFVLLLAEPQRRALHDRVARTQLVAPRR